MPDCPEKKEFATKVAYESHARKHSDKFRPHACGLCPVDEDKEPKVWDNKSSLRAHLETKHSVFRKQRRYLYPDTISPNPEDADDEDEED